MALQGLHELVQPRPRVLIRNGGEIEGQIEAAEFDDLGMNAVGLGGRGDLPGHGQILAAAGCQDQHLRA